MRVRRVLLWTLVLLALAPAVAQAQPPRAHQSITAGKAPSRPYPFMAALRISEQNGTGFCGGTLIAARWVLTAGHCIVDEATNAPVQPADVDVVLGKTNIQAQLANPAHPDWQAVSAVRLAPLYGVAGGAINHDVALLQLVETAAGTQARLPRPADAPLWAPGTPATVIGFGQVFKNSPISPNLLEADLAMRPDNMCGITNGTVDVAVAVCAASGGLPGACQGDSGSPLLVAGSENVVVGPVSLVDDLCLGRLNVFARTGSDPLNTWIRSIVPQAEIDVSPPAPQPGDSVTITSAARNPGGAYTALRWDTDADGAFDDAAGTRLPARVLDTGQYRYGLEASDQVGDREARYLTVDVRPRTPINLTEPRPGARVIEGQPVRLTLSPGAAGRGTIRVDGTAGSAKVKRDFDPGPFAVPVAFATGESAKTLLVGTRDDWRRERRESFRVSLAGATGQLLIGNDALREITILDDDVVRLTSGRTIRVRGNRARVRVRTRVRGTITVRLERRGSRRVTWLGSGRTRLRRKGTATVWVRLNRAGRRALRGRRSARVYVSIIRKRDSVGPPLRRTLRR